MNTLFLSIIVASIVVGTIASFSFFFIAGHLQNPCKFCGARPVTNQPLEIRDATTEPSRPYVGSTFLIYADVYNPNPYPISFESGCTSPLTATFDKNVKVTMKQAECFVVGKLTIEPGQQARVSGPSMGTDYTATSEGNTNAMITFTYEANGIPQNVTTSMQFTIGYPPTYPSVIFQSNMSRFEKIP